MACTAVQATTADPAARDLRPPTLSTAEAEMEASTAVYPVLRAFHSNQHIRLYRQSVTFHISRTSTLLVSVSELLLTLFQEDMEEVAEVSELPLSPVSLVASTPVQRPTGNQFRQLNSSSNSRILVTEAREVRLLTRTRRRHLPPTGLTRRMCSARRAAVRPLPFPVRRRPITTLPPPHRQFIINNNILSNL